MEIRREKVAHTLEFFRNLDLISVSEMRGVLWVFEQACPFREHLGLADSIHVHIKVDDTIDLPHAAIRNAGGHPETAQMGYVKYAFPAGINTIFSSIPVAEDDGLGGTSAPAKPFLDHAGLDMRTETRAVRRQFDSIPEIAQRVGWRHVPQGGTGRAVHCCHTQVNEKHWVYPPVGHVAFTRPLEFALGPLVLHESSMGCDLRPIDPSHPRARDAACCSAVTKVSAESCCETENASVCKTAGRT
jgi:hypothetical protein